MTETTENRDLAEGAHVTPELQQAFVDRKPLVGGGRPTHPLILEAQRTAREGWKWDAIKAELEKKADILAREDGGWGADDIEMVDEGLQEVATYVGLGTHVISPSGKVYTPFATGNLNMCPECGGTGHVDPEKYTPLDRLYLEEALRLGDMKFPGTVTPEWAAWIERKSSVNSYGWSRSGSPEIAGGWHLDCSLCAGEGLHEPNLDSVWYQEMEVLANARDLFIDQRESDNGYQVGLTFTLDSSPEDGEE